MREFENLKMREFGDVKIWGFEDVEIESTLKSSFTDRSPERAGFH